MSNMESTARLTDTTLEWRALRERLMTVVKRVIGSDAALDSAAADLQFSALGISSLKMVNLMLAVELEFDLAIPQTDITAENFHSIASVHAMLARLLGAQQRAAADLTF